MKLAPSSCCSRATASSSSSSSASARARAIPPLSKNEPSRLRLGRTSSSSAVVAAAATKKTEQQQPISSSIAWSSSPLGTPAAAAALHRRHRRPISVAPSAAAAGDTSASNNTPTIAQLAAESSAAVEAAARALLFQSTALLGDAARGPKSAREAAASFAERAAAQLASVAASGLAAYDPALGAAVRQLAGQFSARAERAAAQLVEAAEAGPGGALEGGRAKAAVEELQAALADAAAGIEGAVIGAGARDAGVTIDRFVQQLRAAALSSQAAAAAGGGGGGGQQGRLVLLGGVGGTGVTPRAVLGVSALWLLVRLLALRLSAAGLEAVPAGPAALVLVPFFLYGAEVLAGPSLTGALADAFAPAVAFCAAWMPLFCVPVVVGTVQVAGSMPTGLLRPLVAVVGACTAATLLIAARLAAPAPPLRAEPGDARAMAAAFGDAGDDGNLPPVRSRVAWATAWTVAAALPVGLTAFEAASFGDAAYFATGLAASIAGFLWGRALPRRLRVGLLQPTVLGGIAAAAASIYQGHLCGLYAGESLDLYLSAGAGGVAGAKGVWGAGDVLLALLGAATAAAGFLLHPAGRRAAAASGAPGVSTGPRRDLYASGVAMSRYTALRAAASAAVASLAVTAIASRLLGLAPEWGRALAVRGSLGSAALPLGDAIGAAGACVGAVLLVQSVLGAALAPVLLRVARAASPAARGAAAGAAAGPLGVAAAADGDARALAPGMLGYALAALTTVALFSWPAARALVLRAVG